MSSPETPSEESLIPYQATELQAARILVLAAHPDDEVFGAGGTIALNAPAAEAIRIWIATDGTKQQGAQREGEGAYGEKRREEARRAAKVLGAEPPLFGSLPDRGLAARAQEVEAALARLIVEFGPDLVLAPSPVEIHPDHRALAESLYSAVARSRQEDADHDRFRFLRIAFYEVSHPLLPNALVDIAEVAHKKEEAFAAYASQQAVRDYASAMNALNAYRRLTLDGSGPVEAFRVIAYAEASTRSLEEFRRSIGPAFVREGEHGTAPVAVVVRTRNRPALLKDALESLAAQTARPARVVVVNDGGASPESVVAPYRESLHATLEDSAERTGRAAAGNRGGRAAREDLIAFLDDDDLSFPDHLERLLSAHRGGPEPVCYSDAVTVVYARGRDGWEPRHRALQYSLDFDPEYLLLANYIPIHTLLLPKALFDKAGGFDETLEYSEDWDFLIRLSFETSFRHVRAVTCEYRVFEEGDGDPLHAAAGAPAFQEARRRIYERYRDRRSEAGLARTLDRLRAQVAFAYERDTVSQGELAYQRESHRRLDGKVRELETRLRTVSAENDVAQSRVAELASSNEQYEGLLAAAHVEIERLGAILDQIYGSRTWKLHLFLERLRGRR